MGPCRSRHFIAGLKRSHVGYQRPPRQACQLVLILAQLELAPAARETRRGDGKNDHDDDGTTRVIAENTNQYSVKTTRHNVNTTATEMRKLFGMHILMGVVHLPRVRLYWNPMMKVPLISETMTKKRFFKLRNNLHIVPEDSGFDSEDRLWKVRPFLELIRKRCLELALEPECSVDEQMTPFKGQLSIKHYESTEFWQLELCEKTGWESALLKSKKVINRKPRGYSAEYVTSDDVVVVIWKDNNDVSVASNFVGIGNEEDVRRQQCRAFEALKTRRILPKFGRLDNVPTVASMDVATCEDISYLVRRVVREELVRLQAGDVHHQCSFGACPEPPPYWMRERHVENRPRTETADFTPRLPFSSTGRGHHRMSSSRRAAADPRPSSTRPLPEDYYASSQNVPAEHDPSPRTSATSAPANVSRQVPVCYTCGLPGHISRLCPRRPPAPPRFSTYPARMYETPVPPRFSTHPPRMHETWTSHSADHRPRQQWPNEFRSESPASERSLTPPPTRSRRSPSPRRRSPSPHQLGN
ncbi:hypothetical protein HPB51_011359 [Rhipicephalus microplus]|uniref:CCHC-type domain-containing protein n=1 Tax=Rhipicephalus microplus TaxID=6941 RepID=A0A9J6DGF8_RHIMP|nr:hypothetical protein HPB51_011359 [Rhipicephalus microplus]